MSVTLCNTSWATSLGGLVLLTSLGLGLGGCSGEDSGGDPADRDPNLPLAPAPGAPSNPTPGATGDDVDEDNPNVIGLDPSTAPSGQPEGSEEDGAGTSPSDAAAVPASDLCDAVADWDPEWVQFEEEVLLLVNEFRSEPADCGEEGQFAAAAPLTMNPILRCSARLHSLDMFERDYFEHETPDGVDPFERMAEAGFVGSGGGENIALGQSTPEEVMEAWMESDGHCANVMRAAFDTLGVGYHPGAGQRGIGSNYWTQNFGAPAFSRGGNRR